MKKVLKYLLFLSLNISLFLNVSCSLGGNPKVKEVLSNYEQYTSLKVTNTISCNDKLASNRTSYLTYKENKVYSYSSITTESTAISSYKKYTTKKCATRKDIKYLLYNIFLLMN